MTKIPLRLNINGEVYDLLVEPHQTLLQVLRVQLGLTGTKENCWEGECGACTVLLDGMAVNSCILLAAHCRDRSVVTIEGLAEPERLHPLQQAFIEHDAIQCGYCTPGMIMTAKAFLDQNPRPTQDEIREALVGNLCRCTGYQRIVGAVKAAAGVMAPRGE